MQGYFDDFLRPMARSVLDGFIGAIEGIIRADPNDPFMCFTSGVELFNAIVESKSYYDETGDIDIYYNMLDMFYFFHERCNLLNSAAVSSTLYFGFSRNFDKLDGKPWYIVPIWLS